MYPAVDLPPVSEHWQAIGHRAVAWRGGRRMEVARPAWSVVQSAPRRVFMVVVCFTCLVSSKYLSNCHWAVLPRFLICWSHHDADTSGSSHWSQSLSYCRTLPGTGSRSVEPGRGWRELHPFTLAQSLHCEIPRKRSGCRARAPFSLSTGTRMWILLKRRFPPSRPACDELPSSGITVLHHERAAAVRRCTDTRLCPIAEMRYV